MQAWVAVRVALPYWLVAEAVAGEPWWVPQVPLALAVAATARMDPALLRAAAAVVVAERARPCPVQPRSAAAAAAVREGAVSAMVLRVDKVPWPTMRVPPRSAVEAVGAMAALPIRAA